MLYFCKSEIDKKIGIGSLVISISKLMNCLSEAFFENYHKNCYHIERCTCHFRYYYDKNIITKLSGCKYTYRFDFASLLAHGMGTSHVRHKNYAWSALTNASVSYPSLAMACQHSVCSNHPTTYNTQRQHAVYPGHPQYPVWNGYSYQTTWTTIPTTTYAIPVSAVQIRPTCSETSTPYSVYPTMHSGTTMRDQFRNDCGGFQNGKAVEDSASSCMFNALRRNYDTVSPTTCAALL